jgi:ATPase subunit of ABC transporter with duplicated ATPase domains
MAARSPPIPATTSSTRQQRALSDKQQQAQFERQQAMLAKEIAFIERFKARASHAAQVQSRVKKLDKIEKVEPPKRRQTMPSSFRPAPRSGEDVVMLRKVCKRPMARARSTTGSISPSAAASAGAVMGMNGAGKSTLLKLVAGASTPMTATVTRAARASRWAISPSTPWSCSTATATVFEWLEDEFPQAGKRRLRTLAGCFGFPGDDIDKKCRVLSGGEKARLVMARMLYDPPNFLVLDEPTNHLDIAHQGDADPGAGGSMTAPCCSSATTGTSSPRCRTACWNSPRGHPPVWRRLHRICLHSFGYAGARQSGR